MTLIGFFATSVRCEKNMGNSREVGSRQWAVGSWMLNCLLLTAYCLLSCSGTDAKFQQYYVQGEELYIKHCSNCHQKSGKGLGLVYPPLGPSDFMESNFDNVLCQMKYGKKGPLIVNGKEFNHGTGDRRDCYLPLQYVGACAWHGRGAGGNECSGEMQPGSISYSL